MNWENWLQFGLLVAGFLGLFFGPISSLGNRISKLEGSHEERCKATDKRLDHLDHLAEMLPEIQADLREVKTETSHYFRTMEAEAEKRLHSPEHTRRDELVRKLVDKTSSLEEARELVPLLRDAISREKTSERRWAATLLLARTDATIAKMELQGSVQISQLSFTEVEDRDGHSCPHH